VFNYTHLFKHFIWLIALSVAIIHTHPRETRVSANNIDVTATK